jgi:hypothetical protein
LERANLQQKKTIKYSCKNETKQILKYAWSKSFEKLFEIEFIFRNILIVGVNIFK